MFETWYKMIAFVQGGLDLSPLITHRIGIDDFRRRLRGDALRQFRQGGDGLVRGADSGRWRWGSIELVRRLGADCVEEVGSSTLLAESRHWVGRARLPSSGRRLRDRDQLGELAEVLGGGGEEELVLGTIRAPQAQAVQLQDALEVGEQHLDLLPLAA